MQPTRTQVLRLYKDLLRYGETLVLTDKKYYKTRIRTEFRSNKNPGEDDISFLYKRGKNEEKVILTLAVSERKSFTGQQKSSLTMLCRSWMYKIDSLKTFVPLFSVIRGKTVDKSQVPVIDEKDLEEHFVRGGGPGGQKVNKGNNCVYLIHKPTGLKVKVHESRYQEQNRKIAREKLTILLDNMMNQENSVEHQKKQILMEKSLKKNYKKKKLTELKDRWRKLLPENT